MTLARALVLCLVPLAASAAAVEDGDIAVAAEKDGATIYIKVDAPVRAPRAIVWQVLTDYDHMSSFLPNVKESVIRNRRGNQLEVYQRGEAKRGILAVHFESVREIELVPSSEVRSRIVSGDNMPAEFTTRIEERDGMLHIVHSGTYTPKMWVPPGIGTSLIEAETRRQYADIRNEIMRRAAKTAAQ